MGNILGLFGLAALLAVAACSGPSYAARYSEDAPIDRPVTGMQNVPSDTTVPLPATPTVVPSLGPHLELAPYIVPTIDARLVTPIHGRYLVLAR